MNRLTFFPVFLFIVVWVLHRLSQRIASLKMKTKQRGKIHYSEIKKFKKFFYPFE